MFGDDATAGLNEPLPLSSLMYRLPGLEIESASYRPFARAATVGNTTSPRLFGISQKGRVVAYYSREDFSNGLVGAPVNGVIGYSPASARALMRNMVMSAAQGK